MASPSTERVLGKSESSGGDMAPIDDEHGMRKNGAEESGWLTSKLNKQFWLAVPMVCVGLLQFFVHLISIMFVGHLGKLELAVASIAISFGSVTGFSVMVRYAVLLCCTLGLIKFLVRRSPSISTYEETSGVGSVPLTIAPLTIAKIYSIKGVLASLDARICYKLRKQILGVYALILH